MKIAMIGHKTVPSREGGVEIVVEELATRMVDQNNEVTLFNRKRKGHPSPEQYNGIKLIDSSTIDKKSLDAVVYSYTATKKVKKMAKRGMFDVVHFHAEGTCAFLRKFPPKNKRKYKLIVTIHGLDWQRGKWSAFASKFIKYCERQVVKYADKIIVLSKNLQKYFKDVYNRETVFIPNGVNMPSIKEASLITENYGLTKDSYILFLARIVPEKGLDYLIEAWKKIPNKNNKKLVIAGGSSHSDEYFNYIKNKCIDDDSIVMTGFVTGRMLEELYSNAYLYVLPSDIEGMPMSLLEALAYGNICLVSDIPENTEVITTEDYIFKKSDIDDLKEKISIILDKNMTTHNRQIQVYSWDDIVSDTIKLYEE